MTEMANAVVWTLTIAESFEVKPFASGLLEPGQENLRNDGYIRPAVFVAKQTELRSYRVSGSGYEQREAEASYGEVVRKADELYALAIMTFMGTLGDWARKDLRVN
jgi:hypothetical protein